MASVIDLYTGLSEIRGLDFGELRHVARAMQTADLLPRAGRKQRMKPPQVTTADCATFLIGLGVSRSSGARIPAELRRRVRTFKRLVVQEPNGTIITFFEFLVRAIEAHLNRDWIIDETRNIYLSEIIFVIDDRDPEARVHWLHRDRKDERGTVAGSVDTYVTKQSLEVDPSVAPLSELEFCADAFVMPAGVFFKLRNILLPAEAESADA